jgi:DNA-directed RNA polymerase sigma subunit (sigma70/sigma32)
LPRSALKAIRLHRKAEAQRETNQLKERAREAARAFLASGKVPARAGQALRLYVGLDGHQWRTYQQIAELMKVSREGVRRLLLPSKIVLEVELAGKVPWRRITKDAEHLL